jgi:hypothetical protein
MEGDNLDYLSGVSIPEVIQRRHGSPAKVANRRSTVRSQRQWQELTAMMALADDERLELITIVDN